MNVYPFITAVLAAALLSAVHETGGARRESRQLPRTQEESAQALSKARELLTPEEWRLVEEESDAVKRVRRLVKLASVRLDEARTQVGAGSFDDAGRTLTHYESLVMVAFDIIDPLTEANKKKRRSAYKEFDIKTRPHLPHLERLTREFIGRNPSPAEAAITNIRRLRAMALNRFSGSKIIKVPESH